MVSKTRFGLLAAPADQRRVRNVYHRTGMVAACAYVVIYHVGVDPETGKKMVAHKVQQRVLMTWLKHERYGG